VKRGIKRIPSLRAPAGRVGRNEKIKRFDFLVDALSAAMARVPAEAVDHEIKDWLEKICLTLDLDRSAVYQRDAPGNKVHVSHTWVRQDFPRFPRRFNPIKVKNSTEWVLTGNELVWSRPDDIPAEWKDLRRFVARYGPQASAIFPMWAGNRVIGGVSFGKFSSPRPWSRELLNQLALAARMFGSAIERKQAEAAARLARSELALTQRRSMMGELVGSLAHELNQPLGAILSNLEGLARLLSQDHRQPALASKAVKNAIQDAKRAGEIVRRVRSMFKNDDTHKAVINVGPLVNEVAELIGNEAAFRGITLRIDDSPNGLWIRADHIQLQQCLLNLLTNSFDAIAQLRSGTPEVTLSFAQEKEGWIRLSVRDNGAGVDPAVADRLFEPFVTTKPKGMGLGLLVTKSIVEGHGGRVWFSPNPEGGTTFSFTLPSADS
jgi:signal transduction histidine kinase